MVEGTQALNNALGPIESIAAVSYSSINWIESGQDLRFFQTKIGHHRREGKNTERCDRNGDHMASPRSGHKNIFLIVYMPEEEDVEIEPFRGARIL